MVVGMIIIDCRSIIEIWMGGVLSRRLIFRFPKPNEYRGIVNCASKRTSQSPEYEQATYCDESLG